METGKILAKKKFEFQAGHYLPNHQGACHRQHGHSYQLEIIIKGPIRTKGPEKGMIVDFSNLKQIIQKAILDKVDHHMLNDIWENPTAEEMVGSIATILKKELPRNIVLEQVELYETSSSSAIWRNK